LRPPHDDDVVTRAKQGDEVAWRALFEAHAGRLEYWLRHRPSGDAAADAGDIAAEAWLTAAQRVADFSGSADDFAGWLFQIARRISTNARRRSDRRSTTPLAVDDGAVWGVAVDAGALLDGADWTHRLIATLPAREAEVVFCLDVVGLDTAATGEALDISTTAVRVSHHRALRRLRRRLQEGGRRGTAQQDPPGATPPTRPAT
jgi:RNA polymerase sigma-70 factor, ECF subfamily